MNILSRSNTDCAYHSREIAVAIAQNSRLNGSDSIVAAELIQQVHYWLEKEQGVVADGIRWIYNSYQKWIETQFPTISTYCFRKIKNALTELGILLTDQKQQKRWNQTYFYTIDYERLYKLLDWEKPDKKSPKPLKSPNVRSTNTQECETQTIECATVEQSITKNTSKEKPTKKTSLSALLEQLPEEEREKFLSFAEKEAESMPYRIVLVKKWTTEHFDDLLSSWKKSSAPETQKATEDKQFAEWYDLMRQLGHAVAQRIENGVVMIGDNAGYWSPYEDISQSYTLDYLRKCVGGKR
ncbi:MAG: hypothetical protein ACRC2S_28465 [Waterburya sp.]